jgi:cyclomaltodextrinase / maltogenic alpha-amylase / neopullulanase
MENSFTPDWVKDSIFYQIFPDRFNNGDNSNDPKEVEQWGYPSTRENYFGGDLQGIREKLDYLQDLGINGIYLNPIFKARTNHKYDTEDYFKVDPAFGTNDLLTQLVQELHNRNMHIILDGVFNHCGEQFGPFRNVEKYGEESRYSQWFNIRSYPITKNPLNYYSCAGCTYLPKLNHENPTVRRYLYRVATHWLKQASIDGWRLDCVQKVPKSFWQDFRKKVKQVNNQAFLVGELWYDPASWLQGDTFDGVTNYLLRDLIINYFSKGILDAEDFSFEISSLLQRLGRAAFNMFNLIGCHDTRRIFTVFAGDIQRLLMAIVFQFTFVGVPLIYYGDEIGMAGEEDPDCRRTMIWDQRQWNKNINDIYRKMIKIRNSHIALRRGEFKNLLFFDRSFAYKRIYGEDEVITIVNPGPAVRDLYIPTSSQCDKWIDLISDQAAISSNGSLYFESIEPCSCMVLSAT